MHLYDSETVAAPSTGMTGFASLLWWTLPTLFVLVLGAVHIPTHFLGDQALYSLAGDAIADRGVMYREFVDIKHPGVHYFYAMAQTAGSAVADSAEARVHVVELAVWVLFGLFLQVVLRSRLNRPELAALAPLATAGAYYASATPWGLTQIEAIPGPLVCVAAWLAAPSATGRVPGLVRSIAAGALAAGAVIFHGHMTAVPLVLLGTAAILGGGLTRMVVMLGGFVAVLGAFAAYFVANGAGAGLLHVYISYPIAAAAEVPAAAQGLERIREPVASFVKAFGVWLVLATAIVLRPGRLRRDGWLLQHLLWGVLAFVIMLSETRTSWPFHFLYFVVPVGVLPVFGIDAFLERVVGREKRWAPAFAFGLALIALLPAGISTWAGEARHVTTYVRSNGWHAFDEYRTSRSRKYGEIKDATQFLRDPDAAPGAIYVFGNPLYYTLSGREQALPRNGWGWEVSLKHYWDELPGELATRRPAYVFVEDEYVSMLADKSPDALELLATTYRQMKATDDGIWFAAD